MDDNRSIIAALIAAAGLIAAAYIGAAHFWSPQRVAAASLDKLRPEAPAETRSTDSTRERDTSRFWVVCIDSDKSPYRVSLQSQINMAMGISKSYDNKYQLHVYKNDEDFTITVIGDPRSEAESIAYLDQIIAAGWPQAAIKPITGFKLLK